MKYVGNLWKRGLINNLLIIAPKPVIEVWKQELEDSFLAPYRVIDQKDKLSPMKPQEHKSEDYLSICFINYEALRRFKGKKITHFYDMVIADESHKIKNPNSIQSKQTYFLSRGSKYRLALSGTPKGNQDWDFFAQYRFINDQIFGSKTTECKREFFEPCGYMMHDLRLKDSKKLEFYRLVNDYSFRITKDEALDLPPLVETVIPVELSPETRKYYEQMEEESLITLEDQDITASLAITVVNKLQQICSGFIYDEDKKAIPLGNPDKLAYLRALLEDQLDKKVVIFCKYTQEIDLIYRDLSKNYKVLVYDGRSKSEDWIKFKTGKYDILLTQIKKGGTGLNLQNASVVIFYSLSYSYIDLSQAKDRVYRSGQKNKVTIYYLVVKNSIERAIYRAIKYKREGAKAILDDYRKSYSSQ